MLLLNHIQNRQNLRTFGHTIFLSLNTQFFLRLVLISNSKLKLEYSSKKITRTFLCTSCKLDGTEVQGKISLFSGQSFISNCIETSTAILLRYYG